MEAHKHGFTRAIVPAANMPKGGVAGMQVFGVNKLSDAISAFDEL
jgi:DNA repair protein RadA/Sms